VDRRTFLGVITGGLLAGPMGAEAQPGGRVYRVGYLTGGSRSASAFLVASFGQGMDELGYVEGRNWVLEARFAEGKFERLSSLAREPVRNEGGWRSRFKTA
jgi:putative ABC transport system substrate-binding protein